MEVASDFSPASPVESPWCLKTPNGRDDLAESSVDVDGNGFAPADLSFAGILIWVAQSVSAGGHRISATGERDMLSEFLR